LNGCETFERLELSAAVERLDRFELFDRSRFMF